MSEVMDKRTFIDKETPDIINAEKDLAERVSGYWNVELQKIPRTYQLDYAILRDGSIASWLELKCRNTNSDEFPNYMISLKKWNACRHFHANTNLKAFLVVAFNDGDFWVDTARVLSWDYKMGGRKDRNWEEDEEPCVYFSMKYFKKFK